MIQPRIFPGPALELFAAAEHAAAQIPPNFPLDATVAVNPFLGQGSEPLPEAAARLERVAGIRVTRPRAAYAGMIEAGQITEADLAQAARSAGWTVRALREAALRPAPEPRALPTVADLAAELSGTDWPGLVADRIGLWAAVHFDAGQALWPAPTSKPWTSWREFARRDLTPEIHGLKGFCRRVADLPADPRAALAEASQALGLDGSSARTAYHRLLMTLGGWAQLARGLGWRADQEGRTEVALTDLLTIRTAWDAALLDHYGAPLAERWAQVVAEHAVPPRPGEDHRIDALLQQAADIAAQRRLAEVMAGPAPQAGAAPDIQAAFCIDVRSEPFRRALESVDPGVATIGFAGFFGLAIRHHPAGSDLTEARAPVLLVPPLDSREDMDAEADDRLRIARRAARAWVRFKMAAVSSFAYVESAGPLYAAKLLRDAFRAKPPHGATAAPLLDLSGEARIDAAETVLNALSLREGFAPLVLIAGHGSGVVNAPHASALQCGACGGHSGEVNARLLADLLNDLQVRAGLAGRGIAIPAGTLFIAGLHDTVSDRVTLHAPADAPDHADLIERLRQRLDQAGALSRAERALRLPRAGGGEGLAHRGRDWSEIRPEWGLAGCSAFIAAPRHRTRGRDFGGRAFLHDYDWRQDDGFGTLELILTAPVVVASWISLQYYGSVVAPEAFGAGNKLLHNVTGGIGVVEGNGGTLRTGLPWQSVHDGETAAHEPLRLSVAVEAPVEAIAEVLERHADLRALFDNGWLALYAMDADGRLATQYTPDGWRPCGEEAAARRAA